MIKFEFLKLNFILLVLLIIKLCSCAEISDKRLCGDPECTVIIAKARTKLASKIADKHILSFGSNVDLDVYSKSAGKKPEYWGVQIDNRRGYVSNRFITETRTIIKEADLIEVPTEIAVNDANIPNAVPPSNNIVPHTPTQNIDNAVKQIEMNTTENDEKLNTPVMEMIPTTPLENKHAGEAENTVKNTLNKEIDEKKQTADSFEEDEDGIDFDEEGDEDDDEEDDEDENDEEGNDDDNEDENILNIDDILPDANVKENVARAQPVEVNEVDKEINNELKQDSLESNIPKSDTVFVDQELVNNSIFNESDSNTVQLEQKSSEDVAASSQIVVPHAQNIPAESTTEKEKLTSEIIEGIANNISDKVDQTTITPTEQTVIDDKIPITQQKELVQPPIEDKPVIPIVADVIKDEAINIAIPPIVNEQKIIETVKEPLVPTYNLESSKASIDETADQTVSQLPTSNPSEIHTPMTEIPDKYETVTPNSEVILDHSTQIDEKNDTSENISSETVSINADAKLELNDTLEVTDNLEAIAESTHSENIETTTIAFDNPDTPVVYEEPTTGSPPNSEKLAETVSLEDILYPKPKINNNNNVYHDHQHDHNVIHHEQNVLHESHDHHHEHKGLVDHLLSTKPKIGENEYCDSLLPNSCLLQSGDKSNDVASYPPAIGKPYTDYLTSSNMNSTDDFIKLVMEQIIEFSNLILYLSITGVTVLVFILGHYCISKCRKERPLILKLNNLERSLMGMLKENSILKNDLIDTRNKLASIEDNSFGSNDMVIALKSELDEAEKSKADLEEQIVSLEKELETAAEAGLELNKMVAELLNQNGSDSIALTVDELQKQLNEQQETIISMNETLAAKSRENSELQILLSKERNNLGDELEQQQLAVEHLQKEKGSLTTELENLKLSFESQQQSLNNVQTECNTDISNLKKELNTYQSRHEETQKTLRKSESKVQTLEECIRDMQKNTDGGKISNIMDLTDLKAELLSSTKENKIIKERLNGEMEARKLLEDHVKVVSEEVMTLKKEHNQAEKEKLEAQTRLEVLSSYFKDKETQLQKELSIKEAMSMQQQGETTSTVERIRTMQDEIQSLKSQNDSLRAEIEAQSVANKAQNSALETRAHDAWISTRQAERKLEEARAEASALRRRLTTLAEMPAAMSTAIGDTMNNDLGVPSPIRVESPNAPIMMGAMPQFLPPPFMAPPPPFMPPPFCEMRPPPLGRLMSPPPNRYSPNNLDDRDHRDHRGMNRERERDRDRDRYSPNNRGRYSPADSRYDDDYSVMSHYDEETDFSPPPSPGPPRHRGGYKAFSPPPPPPDSRNKKSKGGLSSGSQDSIGPRGKKV